MAFFVGGQLMLAAVVVPVLRGDQSGALRKAARRFGMGSVAAALVLLATGAAMASEYDRWGDGTLQVKLVLVALVAVLITVHMRRPQLHAIEAVVFLLSLVIVGLGAALAH
jgi:hypothetical protein